MILKTLKRALIAIGAWLGINAALDSQGIRVALLLQGQTWRRVISLHHFPAILWAKSAAHYLRHHVGGRTCPYAEDEWEDDDGWDDDEGEDADEDDVAAASRFSPPFPDEQQAEFFALFTDGIERLTRSGDLPLGPMTEEGIASHRELARALGVDLKDEDVWRGMLFAFYAVHTFIGNCEQAQVMWPHPMKVTCSLAGAMTLVRESMIQEADDIERLGDLGD